MSAPAAKITDDDQSQLPPETSAEKPSAPPVTIATTINTAPFDDDDDQGVPPMSDDPILNEFLECARYNDEGASDRIRELLLGVNTNDDKNNTAEDDEEKRKKQRENAVRLLTARDAASGRTALHMAASNGHLHLVRSLLSAARILLSPEGRAAVFTARTKEAGHTPLHDAVVTNRSEIVHELVKAAAASSSADSGGVIDLVGARNAANETALEVAEKCGFEQVSSVLLQVDGTVDAYQTEGGKITMDIDDSELTQSGAVAVATSDANDKKDSETISKKATANVDVDDVE